jgi:hypothetical protein
MIRLRESGRRLSGRLMMWRRRSRSEASLGPLHSCLCDERTLHVGDENVQASVWAKANGRYQHSFRWSGVPCAACCSYNFTMGSVTQRSGSLSETSMVGTISFCPTDYDPEEE